MSYPDEERAHWTDDMVYDELNKIIDIKERLLETLDAVKPYASDKDYDYNCSCVEQSFDEMVERQWRELYDMNLVSIAYSHVPSFGELRRRKLAKTRIVQNPATLQAAGKL